MPTKNWKNHLKKLHSYGSWEFLFSAAPTAQNSPELHFRFMNSFKQPSRVESLFTTDKYVVGSVKIGTWNWFWSIRRGYRKVLQFITIFSLHVLDWQMQDRMNPCQNPDQYISQVSNIESDNSQNVGLEDYNNISDGIFPHFTTPSIKISLG